MARTILSCLGLGLATAAAIEATARMIGVGGPEAAAAAALGGLAGNFATDLCRVLYRPVAERWLEGRSGIDENHHVAGALRLAQLKALGTVRERLDTPWFGQGDPEERQAAEAFSLALERFLDDETGSAERPGFLAGGLTADERVLRDAVLLGLPDVLDTSLAARRAGGDNAAIRESLADVRAAAERAVLAEIGLRTATRDLPAGFVRAFDGSGFPDSWFDLFVRDAAFRLKDDAGFERVWQAEQLALVKAIAAANTAVLERIEAVQGEHTGMLQELLALARTGGAFQRAAAQGIPQAAVRAIVERLGGEGIAADDLIPWLDNWIEAATRELGRRTNEGEAFEAARREAERRFRAGRLREASAAFMDELARENRAEAERQAERKRHRITLLEEAIRYDELAFDPPAVVAKLRMIAEIEGIAGPDALGAWLHGKANGFYERGRDKGVNAALAVAIVVFEATLKEYRRGPEPLRWAATQTNLGAALRSLGDRESGTARLEQAVAAYHAALEERTRERVPLDWAGTQNNLGNVLLALGARESGTLRLTEAVAAYRAVLEEYRRERVPLDWALTQNNLGTALLRLGERESGVARLKEAVVAFRAALEERTRERVPLDWAMIQNNVGYALWRIGERESGSVRLEQAVAAYRAALEVSTRKRVPLVWAGTMNNLGSALGSLGERESGSVRLGQAVAAYRAALEERTRKRVPLDWAMTQNNLGNAIWRLGERGSGTARLEEAVTAYRAALEERTRERVPLDWAMTQNNLGNALARLGERERGSVRLEQAVAAYRAALEEYRRERVPLDWAMTQNNLGVALWRLSERGSGTARLEEAVTAFRAALEERTRERVPLDWARTQNNLGNALLRLGERESGTARLEQAVAAYRAALEECRRERVPLDWATSFGNQGAAMMLIADRRNDAALVETAMSQIELARDVTRAGGHAANAANYDAQIPKARAIVARLSGR